MDANAKLWSIKKTQYPNEISHSTLLGVKFSEWHVLDLSTLIHQAFKETRILSENTPAPGRLRLPQHVACGGGHSASSLQQRKRATSQTTLMTGCSPHPWTIPSFHRRPGRRKTTPRDRPTGLQCPSQHTAVTLLGTTHWWREEGLDGAW